MTERSRFWGGIVTGDATAAPYDAETEFSEVLMSISGANKITTDRSGVFRDNLNAFLASSSTSPVVIASGRAICYGAWYESDANVNVTIPTPSGATRVDRIVLRKSWSAQTVRITRIAGTEGAGTPALTQTPGTTWDEPLWLASITTGGIITLTDERKFILEGPANSLFGDGSDGDVTITTTVTLTRDMFYNNLTIGNGGTLIPAAFRIFVKGTLTITGTGVIAGDGAAGVNAAGATGGAAVAAILGETCIRHASGLGASGSTGAATGGAAGQATTNTTHAKPHTGVGGNGGNGGTAGGAANGSTSGGSGSVGTQHRRRALEMLLTYFGTTGFVHPIYSGASGGGGCSGGGEGANSGGGGGSGGQCGDLIMIFARNIVNGNVIRANGGNGGNGAAGVAGNAGGGGGGGGGSGGTLYLVYASITVGTLQVNGGSGGNFGAGSGTGSAGTAGASGTAGLVTRFNVATGQWE